MKIYNPKTDEPLNIVFSSVSTQLYLKPHYLKVNAAFFLDIDEHKVNACLFRAWAI